MKVAITSTVVLDIRNPPREFRTLVRDLLASNRIAIGQEWETTSGVRYTMVQIEEFEVEVRP